MEAVHDTNTKHSETNDLQEKERLLLEVVEVLKPLDNECLNKSIDEGSGDLPGEIPFPVQKNSPATTKSKSQLSCLIFVPEKLKTRWKKSTG